MNVARSGDVSIAWRYLPAGNDDLDIGPSLVDCSGQVETAHRAWHLNIDEGKNYIFSEPLEQSQCGVTIASIIKMEASLLKYIACMHEDQGIIIHYEGEWGGPNSSRSKISAFANVADHSQKIPC